MEKSTNRCVDTSSCSSGRAVGELATGGSGPSGGEPSSADLENWWRQFTPAEIAAIDADIAKLDRLMAERRQKMLAELDTLETSARSELRVIHQRRAELLGRQGVLS